MPCYKPIPAYRGRGMRGVSFKHTEDADEVALPCGQCIGCRLERSRQWAVRCMHEGSMHEENSFITLTYNPESLPDDGCVNVCHFQDFMKRLRSRLSPKRIRFFHCGEYGDNFSRPHYHSIIFGFDFPDRKYFKEVNGCKLFTSEFLSSVWGNGYCVIGDLSFESAAYVARYVVKKVNGDAAADHYWSLDERTGELRVMTPEYATMSRRPGIGSSWYEKFGDEVRRDDSIVMRGFEMKPPRFYDEIFDSVEGMDYETVKDLRVISADKHSSDNTPARLAVREICKESQLSFLKRGYEHDL